MLTFVEAISLAGDRAKQNDDACGATRTWGWVIDGATDLHETPLTNYASDAAWIATYLSEHLAGSAIAYDIYGANADDLRHELKSASEALRKDWAADSPIPFEKWRSPIASALVLSEFEERTIELIELGDCRCFMLDADGAVHIAGGPQDAADAETQLASLQTDAHKPLLQREVTVAHLRQMRASLNREGAHWTFCLDPACAKHARTHRFQLKRPAHLLLMTDGFSALVDRYHAYDAAGLVRTALAMGLQELGRELRAIEAADSGGAKHPRFKASDDATALLLRLT
ncbi:MAG: protein phosphatase 2C domain-containing protein [Phycisphaerales bacterium]|nr:protein phosphatase 2C domain-containing protein [Hyphomonadaceae bacterium]